MHDQSTTPAPFTSKQLARFWAKIDRSGGDDSCWFWTASRTPKGYGQIRVRQEQWTAHRMMWFITHGSLPSWPMVIDHICKVKHCVNPSHLRVLHTTDNILRSNEPRIVAHRKNQCTKGHSYTPENTYVAPSGNRRCRICLREKDRRRAKRRAIARSRADE